MDEEMEIYEPPDYDAYEDSMVEHDEALERDQQSEEDDLLAREQEIAATLFDMAQEDRIGGTGYEG